jgi:hypothetical protein
MVTRGLPVFLEKELSTDSCMFDTRGFWWVGLQAPDGRRVWGGAPDRADALATVRICFRKKISETRSELVEPSMQIEIAPDGTYLFGGLELFQELGRGWTPLEVRI